jgi:hypothetical protein
LTGIRSTLRCEQCGQQIVDSFATAVPPTLQKRHRHFSAAASGRQSSRREPQGGQDQSAPRAACRIDYNFKQFRSRIAKLRSYPCVGSALTGSRGAEAMNILSPSARATPRSIACAVSAALVLAGIVAGFTVAGTSGSASSVAVQRTDFDFVFASVNEARIDFPKVEARIAIDQVFATLIDFAGLNEPQRAIPEAAAVAFDQVFASIRLQPDDTPPNREKLRNAGWRRVLPKS